MPEFAAQQFILIVFVGLFTLAAAYSDFRERKVPNRLTLPMFGVGWVYQLTFFGFSGVADAGLAFLLGFGMLFVLWLIGGGGGGDVKLMGALSVWLGFRMTMLVLIASTLLVILATIAVLVANVARTGFRRTKPKYVAEVITAGELGETMNLVRESSRARQQRRIMAYAIPVAVATWVVMLWKVPLM